MPYRRSRCATRPGLALAFVVLVLGLATPPARAQVGLAVSGVGPINRSMGGATVAAPLDAAGALYWNPAAISGLPQSEMEFGIGFLVPRTTITSRAPAGSIGNATNLGATTGGNNGVFLLPVIGVVYSPKESPWTYGLGIYEIGGFGVNYPLDPRNPVLNARSPLGQGVGPLYTQLQIFQFSPTAALKLTDRLSVGAAANIDYGLLYADPALFSSPSLVFGPNGRPAPVYPSATAGRSRAGGGFQAGVYYEANDDWNFGASFNSPQWFDTYTFHGEAPNGRPARPQFGVNFPWTASVGLAYKGVDRLLIASDFRFMDYRDTDGFRHGGFGQSGQVRGLGWQNVFALGLGAQYLWTDKFSTRVGYTFNMNPIGGAMTSYNVGTPLVIMNTLAAGASYNLTPAFKVSVAYSHDFQNSISGPLVEPFVGRIPGSSVRTAATADAVYFGATVAF